MELLTKDAIRHLMQAHEPPCVSVYQPTFRRHPENQQDAIRFRNLLRDADASLRRRHGATAVRELLGPLQELADDGAFWNHSLDGLGVLRNGDSLRVFRLRRAVQPRAIVADTFHVTPLLREVQAVDRFHVLLLSRRAARLYQGDRYLLDEVPRAGLPTFAEAVGDQVTAPHQTVASYAGTSGAMHHGHGSRKDEIDKDTERYFRAVSRALSARLARNAGGPLVLAALPEHQALFRSLNQNHGLLNDGVVANPEAMSAAELGAAAWRIVEPLYQRRLTAAIEAFNAAAAQHKGTAVLREAALAAVGGRVATLLIEEERVIPGRMDPSTGAVTRAPLDDPGVGDVLDDVAEAVMGAAGDVMVVPKEQMPTSTGLAATLRY